MPWNPLPRIAFAIATYPFQPVTPRELPLELGDELYIIEESHDAQWFRGYYVSPPSLLSGLTATKGQHLETRVFSGIFPRNCVEIKELVGDADETSDQQQHVQGNENRPSSSSSPPPSVSVSRPPLDQSQLLLQQQFPDGIHNVSTPTPSSTNNNPFSTSCHSRPAIAVAPASAVLPAADAATRPPRLDSLDLSSSLLDTNNLTLAPTTTAPRPTPNTAAAPTSPRKVLPTNGNNANAADLANARLGVPTPRDPNAPKPPAPVPMLKIGDETPTSTSEPLIDEIASCFREWHSAHLHELLLNREYDRLDRLSQLIQTLDHSRQQLLHNILTVRGAQELRERTIWDLIAANKLCGGEVIVRDPQQNGRILTADDSPIDLARLQAIMSLFDQPPLASLTAPLSSLSLSPEPTPLHHILVSLRGLMGSSLTGPSVLEFFLISKRMTGVVAATTAPVSSPTTSSPSKTSFLPGPLPPGSTTVLSETFSITIPSGGFSALSPTQLQAARTLFTNLTAQDIGEVTSSKSELFLAVRIRSVQFISHVQATSTNTPSSSSKTNNNNSNNASSLRPTPSLASHKDSLASATSTLQMPIRNLMRSKQNKASASSPTSSSHRVFSAGSHQGLAPTTSSSARPFPSTDSDSPSFANGNRPSSVASPPFPSSQEVSAAALTSTSPVIVPVERVTGAGILRLNPFFKDSNSEVVDHVIPIWAPTHPSTSPNLVANNSNDYDPILLEIIRPASGQLERVPTGDQIQVETHTFQNSNAERLLEEAPTLLDGVTITSRRAFAVAPAKPRSDIYLTIDSAALADVNPLPRFGSLHHHHHHPDIAGRNLQVAVEVRSTSTGTRIENCFHATSNSTAPSSLWRSTVIHRGEAWKQTVRLAIPPAEVADAHLAFYISDAPSPAFAVAYLPLWDRTSFRADGVHTCALYRFDDHTANPLPTSTSASGTSQDGYLSLPWSIPSNANNVVPAHLTVETLLSSTSFSQDSTIIQLLQWRDKENLDKVPQILKQVNFVHEMEIVKMASEILDALFGILLSYTDNEALEDQIFSVLVTVLSLANDRRYGLESVMEHYAQTNFNYPLVTPHLLRAFSRLLEKPTHPDTSRQLRATFKVVRHLIRFISLSRQRHQEQSTRLGLGSNTPTFARNLHAIFKALNAMMSNNDPVLVGSQTLAVQHFHTWLPELVGLLSTSDVLHIAIDFMDACSTVRGKLVLYKLILVLHYARLDIFATPDQRAVLATNTSRWIDPHWGYPATYLQQLKQQLHQQNTNISSNAVTAAQNQAISLWPDQIRLCCSILVSQMSFLGHIVPKYVPKLLESYLYLLEAKPIAAKTQFSPLFPTAYPFPTKSLPTPPNPTPSSPALPSPTAQVQDTSSSSPWSSSSPAFDEARIELVSVLAAMSMLPKGLQLDLAPEDLGVLVENAFRVYLSILNGEAFPSTWLSMHIYHIKASMHSMRYLSSILYESFLSDPDDAEEFNTELWKLYFSTLLKLVGSPVLALETFPDQKRRAVWKIAGDVREMGAELLRRMWDAIGWEASEDEIIRYGLPRLGGYQVQYVPSLVGPIVELCLSVHQGLRHTAVSVLRSMIVSEWTLSEDLSVIQEAMMECLDQYFKTRKPLTESVFQKFFVHELSACFAPLESHGENGDEAAGAALEQIMQLIGTLDVFIDHLAAVHVTSNEDGIYSSSSSSSSQQLMNQLRLMEFLRDMNKEDIFIRYVHQLAQLQVVSRNYTEAGLALRLHAELYEWDPLKRLAALCEPPFPAQSHFERKERLYFDLIKYFEEGEAWYEALSAYKELQVQYESNIFDFGKLARTERAIANIYERLGKTEERVVPKYFYVVYKGLGFPATLRDKAFIFEGRLHERTAAFTDRMMEMYPSAHIVASGAANLDEADGQFVMVSSVSPHRDLSHPVYQRARVPLSIRDFLVCSSPQFFAVPTKRNTTGPVTEHYTEKTVYTIAEPLPTILRRSEVIKSETIRLSSYETGLERILRKTSEIAALEKRVANGEREHAKLLVDAVTISLNGSSEHSVSCYRQLISTNQKQESSKRTKQNGSRGNDTRADSISKSSKQHLFLPVPNLRLEHRNHGDLDDESSLSSGFGGDDEDEHFTAINVKASHDDEDDAENDDDEYGEEDDEDQSTADADAVLTPAETAIKMALLDHVILLRKCLATFGRSSIELLTRNLSELQYKLETTYAPELSVLVQPTSASTAGAGQSRTAFHGTSEPSSPASWKRVTNQALMNGGSHSPGLVESSTNNTTLVRHGHTSKQILIQTFKPGMLESTNADNTIITGPQSALDGHAQNGYTGTTASTGHITTTRSSIALSSTEPIDTAKKPSRLSIFSNLAGTGGRHRNGTSTSETASPTASTNAQQGPSDSGKNASASSPSSQSHRRSWFRQSVEIADNDLQQQQSPHTPHSLASSLKNQPLSSQRSSTSPQIPQQPSLQQAPTASSQAPSSGGGLMSSMTSQLGRQLGKTSSMRRRFIQLKLGSGNRNQQNAASTASSGGVGLAINQSSSSTLGVGSHQRQGQGPLGRSTTTMASLEEE